MAEQKLAAPVSRCTHRCPDPVDLRPIGSENGLAEIMDRLTSVSVQACRVCGTRKLTYAGRITATQRRALVAFAREMVA